jgi:hypothetical protein
MDVVRAAETDPSHRLEKNQNATGLLEISNGSAAHWAGLVLAILLILVPIIGVWQSSHPLGDP